MYDGNAADDMGLGATLERRHAVDAAGPGSPRVGEGGSQRRGAPAVALLDEQNGQWRVQAGEAGETSGNDDLNGTRLEMAGHDAGDLLVGLRRGNCRW